MGWRLNGGAGQWVNWVQREQHTVLNYRCTCGHEAVMQQNLMEHSTYSISSLAVRISWPLQSRCPSESWTWCCLSGQLLWEHQGIERVRQGNYWEPKHTCGVSDFVFPWQHGPALPHHPQTHTHEGCSLTDWVHAEEMQLSLNPLRHVFYQHLIQC